MSDHLQSASLYRIYQSAVAASFPIPEGKDAMTIARQEAELNLDTSRVHLFLTVHESYAFYIAVDSRELAALPDFTTPLAAALPNHVQHKGDGIYRIDFGNFSAAIIKEGTRLRLISGYAHDVASSIRPESGVDLPLINANELPGTRLQAESWIYRSLAEKTSRWLSVFSMAIISVCMVVALVATAVIQMYGGDPRKSVAVLAQEAADQISRARFTQPLGDRMVRIIEISRAVVETGGWVDAYVYTEADGESFTLSLPGWVTAAAVAKLGQDVTTHLQPGEGNLIWARKANFKGVYPPGPGPAEVNTPDSTKNKTKAGK